MILANDFNVIADPNPASNLVNLAIEGKQVSSGKLMLIDNVGRVVLVQY